MMARVVPADTFFSVKLPSVVLWFGQHWQLRVSLCYPTGELTLGLTCRRKSAARWFVAGSALPPDRAAAVDISPLVHLCTLSSTTQNKKLPPSPLAPWSRLQGDQHQVIQLAALSSSCL